MAPEGNAEWARETRRALLRARARALAEDTGDQESLETIELLEFHLAHEVYGVESAYVTEVYPLKDLTPIPSTPEFVLGIINVRGRIVSVVDVKKFFDLPEKGLTDLNKVIILQSAGMEFGILADVIVGVRKIPAGELQPPLPTLTGIRLEYLKGIAGGNLVVLDAAKLLADRSVVVNHQG
ncbi:hypothetical protein DESUT3_01960 [Desulfuromonas versatilis]|uniref:CheW-like domain-containing protein n=1 Tax=Desulfuromonas versatilis TaxID=2802975 RepID=A0ABN6DTR3_9BACT|nr:chemotaxis protein CheW [Desulfuromonas versatilis]BCR03127.1 hypothetical protein DESUT3_01960 [Desulfuromonas versatilis]